MILELFWLFIGISMVMIIIGLAKPSESAQAIIGFFFLFLLAATIVIPGNLEYRVGSTTNTTYEYDEINMVASYEAETYIYEPFNDETGASGFGYWLAIGAAVGMAGVFYSLKRTRWSEE